MEAAMQNLLGGADIKRERIIEAATAVFSRYGHARTTMGDIAESAGISRPALYLVFPRKDDIFAAVILRMNEQALDEYRSVVQGLPTLAEKLHYCCERWGAHGFDLTEVHPDAKDLFDVAFAPVREIFADFQAFLAELITGHVAATKIETTPDDLARILVYAMRGFKETAENGADMRRMIALHVDVVVAVLEA